MDKLTHMYHVQCYKLLRKNKRAHVPIFKTVKRDKSKLKTQFSKSELVKDKKKNAI